MTNGVRYSDKGDKKLVVYTSPTFYELPDNKRLVKGVSSPCYKYLGRMRVVITCLTVNTSVIHADWELIFSFATGTIRYGSFSAS